MAASGDNELAKSGRESAGLLHRTGDPVTARRSSATPAPLISARVSRLAVRVAAAAEARSGAHVTSHDDPRPGPINADMDIVCIRAVDRGRPSPSITAASIAATPSSPTSHIK